MGDYLVSRVASPCFNSVTRPPHTHKCLDRPARSSCRDSYVCVGAGPLLKAIPPGQDTHSTSDGARSREGKPASRRVNHKHPPYSPLLPRTCCCSPWGQGGPAEAGARHAHGKGRAARGGGGGGGPILPRQGTLVAARECTLIATLHVAHLATLVSLAHVPHHITLSVAHLAASVTITHVHLPYATITIALATLRGAVVVVSAITTATGSAIVVPTNIVITIVTATATITAITLVSITAITVATVTTATIATHLARAPHSTQRNSSIPSKHGGSLQAQRNLTLACGHVVEYTCAIISSQGAMESMGFGTHTRLAQRSSVPSSKHAPHAGTPQTPPTRAREGRVRLMRRGGHIITLITIEASWGGTYHRWEPKPGSTAHNTHTALLIIVRPTVIRLNVSSTYGNTELGNVCVSVRAHS